MTTTTDRCITVAIWSVTSASIGKYQCMEHSIQMSTHGRNSIDALTLQVIDGFDAERIVRAGDARDEEEERLGSFVSF